jgi:hypothetical protein
MANKYRKKDKQERQKRKEQRGKAEGKNVCPDYRVKR